jgi:hypothetical protein
MNSVQKTAVLGTSSSAEVKECVELYLHSPSTPSLHGAQLKKHGDNFAITFY